MTKTQSQQLVIVLLLLLFVGVVFLMNKQSAGPGERSAGPLPEPASAPEVPPAPEVPSVQAPEPSPDLIVPRDVFQPPAPLLQRLEQRKREAAEIEARKRLRLKKPQAASPVPQTPAANLELQGIFWGIARPKAIINRKTVSVGDSVEGAEVEAITPDGVLLSKDGQRIELKPKTIPLRRAPD